MVDLIAVSDFKDYEGVTSTNEDSRIETIIGSVSQIVKSYIGIGVLDFNTTNGPKTEYFDIADSYTDQIFPNELPIISVTSVKERETQSESWVTLYSEGDNSKYDYVVNTDVGIIYRTSASGRKYFPKGDKSVEVVYTAGYDTLPADLKIAIFDLVRYYKNDEFKLTRTTNASTIINPGSSSINDDPGFPDHIRRVLDMYRFNFIL